jgi:predicted nucleotidyltransferase
MLDAIQKVLAADPRIAYGLVFGSVARGNAGVHSDLDLAIGLQEEVDFDHRDVGALVSRLESATGRVVDLVIAEEAPIPLAWRIFRDGVLVLERNHERHVAARSRAMLRYLDFQPVDALCTQGALKAAANGG